MADGYEWDPQKSYDCYRRRGFSFDRIVDFDWTVALNIEDRDARGEYRFRAIGPTFDGAFLSVVHTDRGETIRIISMRLATESEIKKWRRYRE
ncbi:MAG: BrnT family toxin [Neomegalonema sp.]|nr:BrnT family toxin [Neomegalonema sp.]